MSGCVGPECVNDVMVKSISLCSGHYAQERRGVPLRPLIKHPRRGATMAERVADQSEVDEATDCVLWLGNLDRDGYGHVKRKGIKGRIHRYLWEELRGPIAEGLVVDHTCHVRNCVNIDHLRVVTNPQNLQNRKGAHRTSATGVRGVFPTPNGNFRVRVKVSGKFIGGGTYTTIEQAEARAIEMRMEYFTHTDGR